jgi:hypothetical protein
MTIKLWPFRPDWEGGVLERLEWLTDVMASTKGAEQRRPQRLTPRKTLEVTFLPHGRGRSVFDLYVMQKGNDDWYIPLWYDVGVLRQPVAIDAGVVMTDVTFREFTLNGLAVIRTAPSADDESTTFTYEIVKVLGRSSGSLLVQRAQEGTTARVWGKGSEIYPLRKARFTDQPKADIVAASVHSTQMSFTITEPNEWQGVSQTAGYGAAYSQSWAMSADVSPLTPMANLGRVRAPENLPLFEGFRVLTIKPDYAQDMSIAYDRVLNELDNGNGIPRSSDTLGFAVPTQRHTWFIQGREDAANLRTLLYWLRGKVRPLWVPTFNDDVQLIAPAASGAMYVDIQDIGFVELGGGIGRQVLAINLNDNSWIFRRVVSAVVGAGFERLELSEALPQALNLEDIYKISFMAVNRLAQDTVEINHVTDLEGLTKVVTTFRASPDLRQYLPWTAKIPSAPASCPKTCEGMTRVDDFMNFGLPNFSWSAEACLTTAKGAYMRYKLAYSQTFVSWYDTEITDNALYLAADLANRDYWTAHAGWVYDQTADSAFYEAQKVLYWSHTRVEGQQWISDNLPLGVAVYAASLSDAAFQEYYVKQRAQKDFEVYTHDTELLMACHPRRWLPMAKMETVPATCEGGMLGTFCMQSMWSVEEGRTYPNQTRGAATLYTAGVVERLQGVDPGTWPTSLASQQGIYYRMVGAPLSTNGVYRNCGCIPLQFEENHQRLSAPTSGIEDPTWVQWFHYSQIALLTPDAWPTEIRVLVYDSLSSVLLRTMDITIENFEVTAKADEYHALSGDDDYTANLVVFREMYNREADGQTTFHPDPWDGAWNLVPVAVDGIKVEIYAR